jgi:hypothetical protein
MNCHAGTKQTGLNLSVHDSGDDVSVTKLPVTEFLHALSHSSNLIAEILIFSIDNGLTENSQVFRP